MRKTPLLFACATLLAACEGATDRVSGIAPDGEAKFHHVTCATPAIVSPKNNVLLTGSSAILKWTVSTCRTVEDVEVYENTSGTLVFSDATPEWETYMINNVFEYSSLSLSGYTPGKYYKWRVRSKLQSDGVNPEEIGPWSAYGVFGIPLATPSTSASVSSGKPSLSWSGITGASSYKINRFVDEAGYWYVWDTPSGTSYSDALTNVTGYLGTSQPSSGKWVAYRVSAVSSDGIESSTGVTHYFSYTGIIMW